MHLKRARRDGSQYIHEKGRKKCKQTDTLMNHAISTQYIERETSHWSPLCELPVGSIVGCVGASVTGSSVDWVWVSITLSVLCLLWADRLFKMCPPALLPSGPHPMNAASW